MSPELISELAKTQVAIELGFADYEELCAAVDPPRWLRARLERERRKVLSEIGVDSIAEAQELALENANLRTRLSEANEALTAILSDLLAPLSRLDQDRACEAGNNGPLGVFRALKSIFWSPKK